MGILADEWERHAAQLASNGCPPKMITTCRHAWYTGVAFTIDAMRAQSKKGTDVTELVKTLDREVDRYTSDEFFRTMTGNR